MQVKDGMSVLQQAACSMLPGTALDASRSKGVTSRSLLTQNSCKGCVRYYASSWLSYLRQLLLSPDMIF